MTAKPPICHPPPAGWAVQDHSVGWSPPPPTYGYPPAPDSQLLREIHTIVIDLRAAVRGLVEQVGEHRLILNGAPGNGEHPGLQTRVKLNEEVLEHLAKELRDFKRQYARVRAWLWATISGALIATVAAICSAVF